MARDVRGRVELPRADDRRREAHAVFGNPAALEAALADARSGSGARSWSIQGPRAAEKDEAAYLKAMGACAKRSFLVSALSDPGAMPAGR